jgi:glycosyltransferase involved in cell wall biosynthesis
MAKVVCVQLGAREHFAVPRALEAAKALYQLITDFWVTPGHPFRSIGCERFHRDIPDTRVQTWNLATVAFEFAARIRGLDGWGLIMERNQWFQRRAAAAVAHLSDLVSQNSGSAPTLFAYSYAAQQVFQVAKQRGMHTVLGQIDPGPLEERIVEQLFRKTNGRFGEWRPPPSGYWTAWREECELADRIMVNSEWAGNALIQEGVVVNKIAVVPLAYEIPLAAVTFKKRYPMSFTAQRPLRVLFLGQVNLRKGIVPLLEAGKLLRGEPVELWFVGPIQIRLEEELKQEKQMHWLGCVSRNRTSKYFSEADVFIFPTFSDGFGLTQLEAQAWKLPVVTSRFCGSVVQDGVNGVLLDDVSDAAIASVLLGFLRNPKTLQDMSDQSGINTQFSLKSLGSALLDL